MTNFVVFVIFSYVGVSNALLVPMRNLSIHRQKFPLPGLRKEKAVQRFLSVNDKRPQQAVFDYTSALALTALVLQNSGLSIAMRLSRSRVPNTQTYLASTAVLLSEVTKFIICTTLFYRERRGSNALFIQRVRDLFINPVEIGRVSIPSALYVLQNNLQYLASSSLPASVYQVLVQFKLASTALFTRFYKGQRLRTEQWACIATLTAGMILVQSSIQSTSKQIAQTNLPLGLLCVALSCVTSGFATVYQEVTWKDGQRSLWGRNTQLTAVSILLAGLACLKDLPQLLQHGFFFGYDRLVFFVVFLHAIGGLIVSIVVQRTNSIVKSFATAGSIILSCTISIMLLHDLQLTWSFVFGTTVAVVSTLAYAAISKQRSEHDSYRRLPPTS